MNYIDNNKSYTTTISVNCISGYRRRENSEESSDRFVRSAELLPDGGELGWEIAVDSNGIIHTVAFCNSVLKVTKEDYEWIFDGCATIEPTGTLLDLYEVGRKVYTLGYIPGEYEEKVDTHNINIRSEYGHRPEYYDEDDSKSIRHFSNLMCAAREIEAIIRIVVKSNGQGFVLISLPESITLRMRAMLSRAFSDTMVMEIDEKSTQDSILLPTKCLKEGISGLLEYLMLEEQKSMEYELEGECEPLYSECVEVSDLGYTPIEELDLSARSFNCLKRAGILSVEKLKTMTDDDFMHVRNLGRKSIEEIKIRLSIEPDFTPTEQTIVQQASSVTTLNELIGLEAAKEQVRRITALAKMKQDLGSNQIPICLNMEFVGNPGTAKTTVARILAGIFNEIGLLASNEMVEVGRADLIAHYEGQTADKVKSVFKQAKGKVLFIDEAYSLVESVRGEYGDEAINTIVQEMENNRDDTIVIFAGYPGKMDELFSCNPGLRSRVPFKVTFCDYSPEEMIKIAELEARKRGFSISQEAYSKIGQLCEMAAYNAEVGNGRFCRNLIEDAVISYATRVYGDKREEKEKNMTLISDDFLIPSALQSVKKKNSIGFAF